MQHVFLCFLEEIEDTKKAFRNHLTLRNQKSFGCLLLWNAIFSIGQAEIWITKELLFIEASNLRRQLFVHKQTEHEGAHLWRLYL